MQDLFRYARWHAALAALLAAGLGAQDPAPETQASSPHAKTLTRALETMSRLDSVRFATDTVAGDDGANRRRNLVVQSSGRRPARVDGVSGTWTSSLCQAETEDGDQLAFANGRMVALLAGSDRGWVLRNGHLADGNVAPLVLDPGLFFTILGEMKLEVTHSEPGSRDDRPVQLLSVTLDDEQVAELEWAGLLPTNPDSIANSTMGIAIGFARAGARAKQRARPPIPERMVDLVLVLDPATGFVFEVRARVHEKQDANAKRIRARLGAIGGGLRGGGADEEVEGEPEEEEENATPTWAEGFPNRGRTFRKDYASFEYRLTLSEHNAVEPEAIPERARRLLGIR